MFILNEKCVITASSNFVQSILGLMIASKEVSIYLRFVVASIKLVSVITANLLNTRPRIGSEPMYTM